MRAVLSLVVVGVISAPGFAEPRCCTTRNPAPITSGPEATFCLAGHLKSLWAPGHTIRIRFLGGSPALQERIKAAARQWTEHANIHFDFVIAEPSDVRIAFTPGKGSWSYIGTQCKSAASTEPTMNLGWFTDATDDREISRVTLHEFGHVLGMIHEHQSPVANIDWDEPVVIAYYATLTPPWPAGDVENYVFNTYDSAHTNFSGFDPKSIMIYPIPNEHTDDDWEVGWNSELSEIDKQHVKVLYPAVVAPSYHVVLRMLRCHRKQEVSLHDEIQVRVFADGNRLEVAHPQNTRISRIPIVRMNNGDEFNLKLACDFSRSLRVELWDIDNPSRDDPHDLLGVVTVAGNGVGRKTIQDRSGELRIRTHEYELEWE